jgi:hypothetical protein
MVTKAGTQARGAGRQVRPARGDHRGGRLRHYDGHQAASATGGRQSCYLDRTGTPTIDPGPLSDLQAQLTKPQFDDFIERPVPDNIEAAAA